MVAFQIIIIVALTIGLAYGAWWCLIELYVKLTVKGSPKPETCTAKEEMEHYQTLLDEWEPVEGSPLHESLVQAIADARARAWSEIGGGDWATELQFQYAVEKYRQRQERVEQLRDELDEIQRRRDGLRKRFADSRRAA